MSFGTDLGDAYTLLSTTSTFNEPTKYGAANVEQQQPQQQQQQQQHQQPKRSIPQSTMLATSTSTATTTNQVQQDYMQGHAQAQAQVPTQIQTHEQVHAQTQAQAQPRTVQAQPSKQVSHIDNLGVKRREMLKVLSYALMILLALAIYTAFEFWLKELIHKNDFSFKQELGIKCAYPFVILLIIWNLKAYIST